MYQYVQCLQGFSIRCYPQCFLSNEIFGSVHVTSFSVTLANFSRKCKRLEFSRQNYPPSSPLFIYSFCSCISAHRAASVFVGGDFLHVVGAVFMRWICLPHVKPPGTGGPLVFCQVVTSLSHMFQFFKEAKDPPFATVTQLPQHFKGHQKLGNVTSDFLAKLIAETVGINTKFYY